MDRGRGGAGRGWERRTRSASARRVSGSESDATVHATTAEVQEAVTDDAAADASVRPKRVLLTSESSPSSEETSSKQKKNKNKKNNAKNKMESPADMISE